MKKGEYNNKRLYRKEENWFCFVILFVRSSCSGE
jgi:hypothetical protein